MASSPIPMGHRQMSSDSKIHSVPLSLNKSSSNTSVPAYVSTPAPKNFQKYTQDIHADLIRLTPVNIKCLTSPIRQAPEVEASTNTAYNENFNIISKQLETLLCDLNVIYNKIGYSNSEKANKEKLIFKILSEAITGFFDSANETMKNLIQTNEADHEILNKMLQCLNDTNGLQTIPDLYIRNTILTPSAKTVPQSPKKPVSLLSERKLLKAAQEFIFDTFIPRLMDFLKASIRLQKVLHVLGVALPEGNIQIPELQTAKFLFTSLQKLLNEPEKLSIFIRENKELLFGKQCLKDISAPCIKKINDITQSYEKEYHDRIKKLRTLAKDINILLKDLELDIQNDFDKEIIDLISIHSTKPVNNEIPAYQNSILQLQKVYDDYKLIHSKRIEQKDSLQKKCEALWTKLKISQKETTAFIQSHPGLSLKVLEAYSNELLRLEMMKRSLMKTLIQDSLQKIEELWTTLQYLQEEKETFLTVLRKLQNESKSLADDEVILETCEMEIKNLNAKLAIHQPVLKLVAEFNSLHRDTVLLDKSSKDSSRLLSRNSHKILLQEEKTRKRITRHFPRVIQELKPKLKQLEEAFGRPFTQNGKNFMDVISAEESELLSKYPRIRLHVSTKKAPAKILDHIQTPLSKVSNRVSKQTPSMRRGSHIKVQSKTPNRSVINKNGVTRSLNKESIAPSMLSSSLVTNRKPLNILVEDSVSISTNKENLEPLKVKNGYIRPTRLFPVSSNILNKTATKTQIPILTKPAKKNFSPIVKRIELSSPIKEPDNSRYRISMSPEGKCQLNIQGQENDDGIFDDTSIMDDDNDKIFNTWKREQLSKLQGHHDDERETSIDWDRDIL